jgi:hypothetical protein
MLVLRSGCLSTNQEYLTSRQTLANITSAQSTSVIFDALPDAGERVFYRAYLISMSPTDQPTIAVSPRKSSALSTARAGST